ncbi:MAG: 50S ribosomal protein L18 [Candidatus Bathyarchaeota archaeon]|nr:50S ribosomal protein L18 [Candidatus Bathyarchaeota archaeon]MDH5494699.1 50S ribosomal protein L18 [Candidatus Bathyarchaeota archaeon]
MGRGPSYRVPFRRRREGKTDYKARKALIISKLPRVVTRGSLKHMNVQIIEATPTGDKIIVSANSQELKSYGWQAACGNLPSAYLTGLLCGMRAVARNVKKAVADIGLHQPTKGASVFASLKGVIDAGVDIPYSTEKLPDEKRLKGQHIADYAKSLATSNTELYEKMFSKYLQRKLSPEKLTEQFEATKEKIALPSKKGKTKKKRKRKGKKQ